MKKCPSSGFAITSLGQSSTIQKNAQMSSDRNPRIVPAGNPNGWRGLFTESSGSSAMRAFTVVS